ncbi:MAG: DUF1836 domain-containing protein [Lachnospiraceae bacterium]|nr:DUF1836 domain-containing protein [Lachnospiraceae bacterium]
MSLIHELEEMLQVFEHIPYIRPSMLPKLDLYMDQVTTFMEERLQGWRRNPDDKILTKTMINNYTKNKLLPPPVKKKYSRDHLLLLNYIYYLKNILSIGDIATLTRPLTERYWGRREAPDMASIYRDILLMEHVAAQDCYQDIRHKIQAASEAFNDKEMSAEERNYLQKFVFVCLMSFDIALKKRMIETLIDDMKPPVKRKEKSPEPSH